MHFKLSSAICFNLDQSRILSSGNGLSQYMSLQVDTLNQGALTGQGVAGGMGYLSPLVVPVVIEDIYFKLGLFDNREGKNQYNKGS